MNNQVEMEQPAKRWEVAALDLKLDSQGATLKGISDKQDRLLERQVTTTDLTNGLAVAKDYTDGEIAKVHLIYGPTLSDQKWLRRLLIGAVIAMVLNIGLQVWRK